MHDTNGVYAIAQVADKSNQRTSIMAIDKSKRGTAISANMPLLLAQAVYAQVKNGNHTSAGAVVRAAVRLYLKLDENDEPLEPEPEPNRRGHKRRRGQHKIDPSEDC